MQLFGSFKDYLAQTGEFGHVDRIVQSLVYATGLPQAHPLEIVIFESGSLGQVLSMNKDLVEILCLGSKPALVGEKIVRTGQSFKIPVSDQFLGTIVNPLGEVLNGKKINGKVEERVVDIAPLPILERTMVDEPLETGVTIVDLSVPLGKGQRELVLGDRNTGKTRFLLQTILTQAQKGTVCIFAGVAKKKSTIKKVESFFQENRIQKNTIIVASTSQDSAGIIYLTPYTAMTLAEYFRDQGKDVVVVLDDMTNHAKFYREITLLLERFPGRSSYPGDIFYIHARIMERAGNFSKASISCLPVADTILGDMSGFIQTNLMAMTDGHIFLDTELFHQGRRPAINTFLSVTRVGLQAQTGLLRDLSRSLNSFLVEQDKLRQFMHFGAELSEEIQRKLNLGDRIYALFEQSAEKIVPVNVSVYLLGCLWAGYWKDKKTKEVKKEYQNILNYYLKDPKTKTKIDDFLKQCSTFNSLVNKLKAILPTT